MISHEDAQQLQVHHSSFSYSFPVDLTQAFGVDHIPFLISNAFPCRRTSQSLTSRYSFFLKCSRNLRRLVFSFKIRSSYFEVVISFKPFNSTGAISLLNHFNGVSFEWALTHRSFPRILPDSSNFPGAIPKFLSKFDVRMDFISQLLSKIAFKFFSLLIQPLYSSLFRSVSTSHGGVSRRHSRILKTEEEFLLNPYSFSQRGVVQAWCHPLIIVFDCGNSFHSSGAFHELFQFLSSEGHHVIILHSQRVPIVLQILPVNRSNIL